jgi:hypothetical protein
MAEAGQLAVHPAITPPGISPRQPQHQIADLLAGRRAWRPRIGPFTREETAVPGQQGSWRDEPRGTQRGWEQPSQGCQDRLVGPVRRTPSHLARRSTINS